MKLEALRASEQNTFQQESRGLELDENQGTEYDFLGVYYFPLLFFFFFWQLPQDSLARMPAGPVRL